MRTCLTQGSRGSWCSGITPLSMRKVLLRAVITKHHVFPWWSTSQQPPAFGKACLVPLGSIWGVWPIRPWKWSCPAFFWHRTGFGWSSLGVALAWASHWLGALMPPATHRPPKNTQTTNHTAPPPTPHPEKKQSLTSTNSHQASTREPVTGGAKLRTQHWIYQNAFFVTLLSECVSRRWRKCLRGRRRRRCTSRQALSSWL